MCTKVNTTEAHKDQEGDSNARHGHFDYVSCAENGHSWLYHADLIILVQVERKPEENIIEHVTGWIAKTEMARGSLDIICDPVRAILAVNTLQYIAKGENEGHSTPEVKGCWLLHQVESSDVEEQDEGRLTQV